MLNTIYNIYFKSVIILIFLANAHAKIKFELKFVEKKNHKNFIEIKKNKISLELGGAKLHFSNLFNGNKELGKNFELQSICLSENLY
jgi:hypothetical protein